MSLEFSVESIKNHAVVTTAPSCPGQWHPLLEALVWATQRIGMPEITDGNVEEFFRRLTIDQFIVGAPLYGKKGRQIFITKADVLLHVGLRTNARRLTGTQFNTHAMDMIATHMRGALQEQNQTAFEIFAKLAAEHKKEGG